MKEVIEERIVKSTGGLNTKQVRFSEDGMKFAWKAFIQYSDSISSLVREYTSNSVDAHVEAGVDKNVTIKMVQENKLAGTYGSISFIDYGVGISPERANTIFIELFASSKRDSNELIGGKGIGRFSGLGYTNMVSIKTRYNGIEYFYALHKGAVAPELEKIYEEPTDEGNGTEVTVPIKNSIDYDSFKKAVRTQLRYFDRVEYINCGLDESPVVYKGKNFVYSSDNSVSQLHLSVGKVYYPLNMLSSVVKLKGNNSYGFGIDCPIGLRFEIGELDIVWNREAVEYTERTIKAIEDRYKELVKELEELRDSMYVGIDSLEKYFKTTDSDLIVKGIVIPSVSYITPLKKTYPKYSELKDFSYNLSRDYKGHKIVVNGKTNKSTFYPGLTWFHPANKNFFILKGDLKPTVNKYISWELGYNKFHVMKHTPESKEEWYRFFLDSHGDGTYGDVKSRKLVLELRKEFDDYINRNFQCYDDIVVPEEWKKRKKEELKDTPINKLKVYGTIPIKYITTFHDYNQIRYEFNMSDWLVKEIPRFNGILVYGFQEDDEGLKNIGRVFYASKRYRPQRGGSTLNPKAVKILKIARNNEKFMELTEKHIYVKDLLKQKGGKIVSQFVTARYIDKVLHEIGLPIYMKDETIIGSIAELSELYTKLDEYSKTYYVQKYQYAVTENFEEEMTKLVFSNGLEDKEILADLELFLSYIDKYPVTLLLDPSRLKAEYAKGILEEYVKERGEVNPMLLKKLKEFKKSKDGKTI